MLRGFCKVPKSLLVATEIRAGEELSMLYKISVPQVADVEEIRVLEWHREVGEAVEPGDLLVELETHKAIVEVRAGQKGYLRKILADAGNWQAIGLPLAVLSESESDAVPDDAQALTDLPVDFEIT
jgi:pyruvate/2-oxoglutarate dehydrogenase complex dihydrolipoamide acyltransferase (E2) component